MRDFAYFEPKSISEAISLLAKHKDEVKVIAGGTDLLVEMKQDHIRPKYLINLKTVPGLDYIVYDPKDGLRIGALTTIRALQKSAEIRENYPIIHQAVCQFGTFAIRNVATLGGNLCNAAPSADTAPPLIGLSARAKIAGVDGEGEVSLDYFFTGAGSTVLKTTEILTEIQAPVPPPNTRGVYIKYGIRGTSDLPIVNIAVVLTLAPEDRVCQDIKIVLGNVAPTPLRACYAEEVVREKKIDEALIEKCAQVAADEAHPRPGSFRASPEYKMTMVKVFTQRAIKQAIA
jgi:carbon-monoxide dehydrogenase medium subunit